MPKDPCKAVVVRNMSPNAVIAEGFKIDAGGEQLIPVTESVVHMVETGVLMPVKKVAIVKADENEAGADLSQEQFFGLKRKVLKGRVVVDLIGGTPGTDWPIGTEHCPSNNTSDANQIAATYGIKKLVLIEDLDFDEYLWESDDPKVRKTAKERKGKPAIVHDRWDFVE